MGSRALDPDVKFAPMAIVGAGVLREEGTVPSDPLSHARDRIGANDHIGAAGNGEDYGVIVARGLADEGLRHPEEAAGPGVETTHAEIFGSDDDVIVGERGSLADGCAEAMGPDWPTILQTEGDEVARSIADITGRSVKNG